MWGNTAVVKRRKFESDGFISRGTGGVRPPKRSIVCECVCVSCSPTNPCYDKLSQHCVEECASAAHHVCSHLGFFFISCLKVNCLITFEQLILQMYNIYVLIYMLLTSDKDGVQKV